MVKYRLRLMLFWMRSNCNGVIWVMRHISADDIPARINCQILAILEASDRKRDYVEDEDDDTEVKPLYPRPRTNIRIIQDSFNKLIDVLMDCNVIPDKDGHFNGHASLVCDDGFVMLNPVQNLRWQVEDAINAHPNAFAPFPDMTLWEQLALAVQNHFITLHRRTWA